MRYSLVAVVLSARSTSSASIEILFVVVSKRVSSLIVLLQSDRVSLVRVVVAIAAHGVVISSPFGRLPISYQRSERSLVHILRLLLELTSREVRAVLAAVQIAREKTAGVKG